MREGRARRSRSPWSWRRKRWARRAPAVVARLGLAVEKARSSSRALPRAASRRGERSRQLYAGERQQRGCCEHCRSKRRGYVEHTARRAQAHEKQRRDRRGAQRRMDHGFAKIASIHFVELHLEVEEDRARRQRSGNRSGIFDAAQRRMPIQPAALHEQCIGLSPRLVPGGWSVRVARRAPATSRTRARGVGPERQAFARRLQVSRSVWAAGSAACRARCVASLGR